MKRIFRGSGGGGGSRKGDASAAHHSKDRSTTEQHHHQDDNDDDDEHIIMIDVGVGGDGIDDCVMVGEERDITLPLSGACVTIVTDDYNLHREMSAFITALGGSISHRPTNATTTHALWATTTTTKDNAMMISEELKLILLNCQQHNIPIVSSSWLERMSGLREGEHWSDINVDPYVPPILAMIGDNDDNDNDHHHDTDYYEEEMKRQEEEDFRFVQTVTDFDDDTTQEESVDYTLDTVVEAVTPTGVEVGLSRVRRDPASRLGKSIAQTFAILTQESPDRMEEEAIRRAMELSLLDCALVFRKPDSTSSSTTSYTTTSSSTSLSSISNSELKSHEILGVTKMATPKEIKSAYRKLALKNHPDKGGCSDKFEAIARAYRSLLSLDSIEVTTTNRNNKLKGTAHWDNELQDHRRLVQDLFQAHGSDIDTFVAKQVQVLEELNLIEKDAGATNINEYDELIHNSCFYLSLAASYLRGIGALVAAEDWDNDNNNNNNNNIDDDSADRALIGETALQLKRIIEAAVVKAHPEWAAQGMVGEDVQAFSDFLVYTLDSPTVLSDWAVVIFDTTSGFVDIYTGQNYKTNATTEEEEASSINTITLRYIPGHYQPLVRSNKHARRPTLQDVLEACDLAGVFYVVTDGGA